MDNPAIARVLADIADLLEIKGENAFKIRAYRTAADTVAGWPEAAARLDERQLRELPGIGKDLAARILELAQTGACRFHRDLLLEFPPTILELLRLQGVGPKTVALLYSTLGIQSVDELAAAAREGRLRALPRMGARKEAAILASIEERRQDAGRHLLSDITLIAGEITAYLREREPDVEFVPVGSLRRGCETCGDLDILAVGGNPSLMDTFTGHPRVERVLGHGETKSSVLLRGGCQADLRLVPPHSRGAAMQYFTGSKAHNIVLRDRAMQRGFKLNEYGLFRLTDESIVAGESEASIYEALGLRFVEPELRENRGEVEASQDDRLPRLVSETDIRGDLHMHTTASDGRDSLEAMAEAAQRAGRQYIAITEHSQALAMANGLDEQRALDHARRIRELNQRMDGLTVLAGIECDILLDGRLDLSDDCLAQLDIVVASVHSHFSLDSEAMTDRLLRAIDNPWVDVLGHPTGRRLLRRASYSYDLDRVVSAAAACGAAMEINSQVDRLDLSDASARRARERGVRLVISSDAHSVGALANLRWGVQVARRAWAGPEDVLNTRTIDELRPMLRRHRAA